MTRIPTAPSMPCPPTKAALPKRVNEALEHRRGELASQVGLLHLLCGDVPAAAKLLVAESAAVIDTKSRTAMLNAIRAAATERQADRDHARCPVTTADRQVAGQARRRAGKVGLG